MSIIVVIGDRSWTLQAMHLACTIARDNSGLVVVVKMVRVNNPVLLGDASGLVHYSSHDRHALQECEATAEDYNVPFRLQVCTYADYAAGLAAVADQLDAALLFVPPPQSRLQPWNRFQTWHLHHIINRPVFGLTTPADQPSVNLGRPAADLTDTAPTVVRPARS
jgi:hypothetical protein